METTTNDETKREKALAGLFDVYDPEIGMNVVDLGLIYEINFNDSEKSVETIMTLTTQFCPMGESIQSNVTRALEEAFPEWKILVTLVFEPSWDYSKISPKGLEFLGYR